MAHNHSREMRWRTESNSIVRGPTCVPRPTHARSLRIHTPSRWLLIVGTQTRGALATQVVVVEETLGFRFRSGHERPEAERADETRSERYLFTLTLERRPPLQGCWLVKELLPMRHHMMFAGDSGGTVT